MKTRAEAAPLVFSLGLAGFVVMADNWVVSPLLPAISHDTGDSPVRAAILITAYMLPFAIFQLVLGPLADRYGKLLLLRVTLAGFAVATGLTAIGFSLTDLTIYRALTGTFAAATMPISLALIGDSVRMEDRQKAIGSFMGIAFLGQGVAMGLGGTIAYFLSWRGVFVVYAAVSVAVLTLLTFRSRTIVSPGNPRSEFVAPYKRLVSRWTSLRTYLIVLIEGLLIISSFSFLGAFLNARFSLNSLSIGFATMAFGVTAVIAGRESGRVASLIGRRATLVAGLLLATGANLVLAGLGGLLPAAIVAIALLGAGFTLAHSTLLTMATEFAAQARGSAMSLVAFCLMGGGAVGTALGGRFIEASNFFVFYSGLGILLAILAGGAALVAWDLPVKETTPAAEMEG